MQYLCVVISVAILAPLLITIQSANPPLTSGYVWSKQLAKPAPLKLLNRTSYQSPDGWYDYCVTTVGDNWCISSPSSLATIHQPSGSNASIRFSAAFQDPSCGWLVWRRGPYASGQEEEKRPTWKIGMPENAGPFPIVSMPIITHHGGDYRRWQF